MEAKTVSIRLEDETLQRSDELAEAMTRKFGWPVARATIIRGAIMKGLDRIEVGVLEGDLSLTQEDVRKMADDRGILRRFIRENGPFGGPSDDRTDVDPLVELAMGMCRTWRLRGISGGEGR